MYFCLFLILILSVEISQEEDQFNLSSDQNNDESYDKIYNILSLDDHEDEVKIVNISDKTAGVIDDKSGGASNKVVIILVFVIMFGVILVGGIYFYKNKVDPPSHNKETLKRLQSFTQRTSSIHNPPLHRDDGFESIDLGNNTEDTIGSKTNILR